MTHTLLAHRAVRMHHGLFCPVLFKSIIYLHNNKDTPPPPPHPRPRIHTAHGFPTSCETPAVSQSQQHMQGVILLTCHQTCVSGSQRELSASCQSPARKASQGKPEEQTRKEERERRQEEDMLITREDRQIGKP